MSDDLWIAPAPTIPRMSDGDLILIGDKAYRVRITAESNTNTTVECYTLIELPPAPWWQRVLNYIENKYDEWRYDL